MRSSDSAYDRRDPWNCNSGERDMEGVSLAFSRSHPLEGMESEPVVCCVHRFLDVANLEGKRCNVGLGSTQPLVCFHVLVSAPCEPETQRLSWRGPVDSVFGSRLRQRTSCARLSKLLRNHDSVRSRSFIFRGSLSFFVGEQTQITTSPRATIGPASECFVIPLARAGAA